MGKYRYNIQKSITILRIITYSQYMPSISKEMVEMIGLNNEENLNIFKQVPYLSDDEIEKNDKLLMLTLFDFYKGVLLQYPELLERNAEEICNYQGIY